MKWVCVMPRHLPARGGQYRSQRELVGTGVFAVVVACPRITTIAKKKKKKKKNPFANKNQKKKQKKIARSRPIERPRSFMTLPVPRTNGHAP